MTDAVNMEDLGSLDEVPKKKPVPKGKAKAKLTEVINDQSSQKKTPYSKLGFEITEVVDMNEEQLEDFGGESEVLGRSAYTQELYWTDKAIQNAPPAANLRNIVYGMGLKDKAQGIGRSKLMNEVVPENVGEEFNITISQEVLKDQEGKVLVDEDDEPKVQSFISRVEED